MLRHKDQRAAAEMARRGARLAAVFLVLRHLASRALFTVLVAAGALVTSSNIALAQESASDVTADQVAIYQLGLEMACKRGGRKRGEPPEQVDAFCTCSIRVLKENASFSEWQQAYHYWRKRLSREASDMLAPHMPKIQACKDAL